ncbi:NHL repeat-containing protein [bacterium]|nr:NHL repeat-containing protein [bacterium]
MKSKIVISLLIFGMLGCSSHVRSTNRGKTFVYPPWYHCLGLHKVSQTHLSIYSAFSEEFQNPQGLFCTKLISKDDSTTDYDDDELTVFGLNSGAGHIIYNSGLFSLKISDGSGKAVERLKNPLDLSGDRYGNLFVADSGNNRVVRYKFSNDRLIPIKEIVGYNNIPFDHPSGVSLDGDYLYVTDSGNDRIAVFNIDDGMNEVQSKFGLAPKLIAPTALSIASRIDEWLYYNKYFIVVVDSFGQRLWKIPAEGEPEVFRYESIVGNGGFNHLDIDYYGNIYVTDTLENKIHKFNRNLRYIVAIGGNAKEGISFDQPRGIAIYKRFGQIFVSEKSGCQYFWIGTDMMRFKAVEMSYNKESGKFLINLSFLLTEYSMVSFYIETHAEDERYTIFEDYLFPPGFHDKIIEGKLKELDYIDIEKINILAIIRPTYSSVDFCKVVKRAPLMKYLSLKGKNQE